jgi:hypothetical protein
MTSDILRRSPALTCKVSRLKLHDSEVLFEAVSMTYVAGANPIDVMGQHGQVEFPHGKLSRKCHSGFHPLSRTSDVSSSCF